MHPLLENISRVVFGLICHQDPAILIWVGGREVALCPRCIGLHLGFLSSFAVMAVRARGRVRVGGHAAWLVLSIALASVAFDWGLGGRLGLYKPTMYSRLLTGLACGSALSFLFVTYRRSLMRISGDSIIGLSGLQVGGLIFFSLCIGLAAVGSGNWAFLSTVILLTVFANTYLAISTIYLIIRTRLSNK